MKGVATAAILEAAAASLRHVILCDPDSLLPLSTAQSLAQRAAPCSSVVTLYLGGAPEAGVLELLPRIFPRLAALEINFICDEAQPEALLTCVSNLKVCLGPGLPRQLETHTSRARSSPASAGAERTCVGHVGRR